MKDYLEIDKRLQSFLNTAAYPEALEYLESLKSDSSHSNDIFNRIFYQIGRIKFYQGKTDKAKQNFLTAIKYLTSDSYSKIFLAKILEKQGKPNSALNLLKHIYKQNKAFEHVFFVMNKVIEQINHDDSELKEFMFSSELFLAPDTKSKFPKISILILCYNKIEFTIKCLTTLFKNTSYPNFEVIVVDNSSVDDTPGYLESFGEKIKFIHSDQNLGFVGGNNLASRYAEGEFLVFLNNDTEVHPLWLDHLIATFNYHPDAGAAGSMLIYPDGKLQEAGGVIFEDATGWNYGKNTEPIDSRYNFVREVDYCSGAALMIRKSLFTKLNGFDEQYAPAYYEDTDLCFGVRSLGYKVYFNPFSKVTHYEGATAGTDLNSGYKKYQIINAEKFKAKWVKELQTQYPNQPDLSYHFSNRNKSKRILIIDDIPPLPDRASGAKDHYQMLMQMVELGYNVTYVFLSGTAYTDDKAKEYLYQLKMKGVEFIWFKYESWWSYRNEPQVKPILISLIDSLEIKKRGFDLVYLAFWNIAGYFIDLIKKEIPTVPIVVDSVDIHFLREKRRAELLKDRSLMKEAETIKKNELAVYAKADCIKTVTLQDRTELKKYLKDKSIIVMPGVHDAVQLNTTFDERKDLLFIGNFNHNPNEDAVAHFIKNIFPLISIKIPGIKFYIVGNNPTEKIKNYSAENIIVTGWVPETKPYLEMCRLSVVPLRYGAGYKGKVCETLSHGVPMVATSIAAEGIGIIDGKHSFIADDPVRFAEQVITLYNSKELWEKFSKQGQELIDAQFSTKLLKKRVQYMMSFESKESFKSDKAIQFPEPPEVSIIIVTHNQWHYTKLCLDSIRRFTNLSHEIIIIDNASSDETLNQLFKHYPEIRLITNNKNLGFPEAVNQGIKTAIGDYILLLNNDTEVTEDWLYYLLKVAKNETSIGIVGPISNEVSGVQIDKEANYKTIDEMHLYAASVKEKNKNKILQFPRVAFLCTLIKREVINKIGGLDERFSPGNFEDDDFCLRAQLAGYKTVIAQDVFIHHYGSKSFKADGEKKYIERLKTNHKIFVNKWSADPDEIWLKQKPFNHAKSLFISIDKDEFIKSFERAQNNIKDKEFDLALNKLELSIENYDSSGKAYSIISKEDLLLLSANVSLIIKDLEKAKTYFEEVLTLNPSSSEACFGLGQVFYQAEMFEESKTMLEWAIINDSKNLKASESLALVNDLLSLPQKHNSLFKNEVVQVGV
jgi:GT2 family glycosyltransferase